jgi:hypothetical protein
MPDDPKPDDILKDLTTIGPLYLDDAMGRWMFDPRPDITALELALIMVLFVHTLNLRKRLGWREYLTRDRSTPTPLGKFLDLGPDLARHFKPVE